MTLASHFDYWSQRATDIGVDKLVAERERQALRRYAQQAAPTSKAEPTLDLRPVSADDRSGNELRPRTLSEMVGQERLKPLLRRLIDVALETGRPLDHMLMIGSAGTGKTTVALAIAHELGRDCYQLAAPLSREHFLVLRKRMKDGDVLFVDEIHQQVAPDRRGVTAAAQPESYYGIMEDKRLATDEGVLVFPSITIIGATTDPGLLPEPFLDRFQLQPRLDRYAEDEMAELARRNAEALNLAISGEAALIFARAARATPRIINRYLRNAQSISTGVWIDEAAALEVVTHLNSTELDGLTREMTRMLRFLYVSGRRERADGTVTYQASVNSIATALGLSRDAKAVALYVEPELIARGYVQVAHGGRRLTDAGVERARELTKETA